MLRTAVARDVLPINVPLRDVCRYGKICRESLRYYFCRHAMLPRAATRHATTLRDVATRVARR